MYLYKSAINYHIPLILFNNIGNKWRISFGVCPQNFSFWGDYNSCVPTKTCLLADNEKVNNYKFATRILFGL
jgi:hypothetical protein